MIAGANKIFPYGGKDYHIQVEDLGETLATFEVRVYDGGMKPWRNGEVDSPPE